MSELAAFLLARIDEDQAVATAEVERLRSAPRRGGKTTAARRWVECEAKRRIVEAWARLLPVDLEDHPGLAGKRLGLAHACQLLAMPYADHPDYRSEWGPGGADPKETRP